MILQVALNKISICIYAHKWSALTSTVPLASVYILQLDLI